jgi:hypothetical protein
MISRAIPGTRLPFYVAAGFFDIPFRAFALWTLLAVAIWTPAIILAAAGINHVAGRVLGAGWFAIATGIAAAWALLHFARRFAGEHVGDRIIAQVSRIWRWEFWPAWLFYAPLVPWIGWLSLRHRGFTVITAANPSIPHGGFVGESKSQILAQLDPTHVLPFKLVSSVDDLDGWSYPLILKPDAGQRGAGVKLIRSRDEAAASLAGATTPTLAQAYHRGPHEAGVFYFRLPGEPRGHIFSITHKEFPQVLGDGVSMLEQLIWRHPRLRMQAKTFLTRHAAERHRVLSENETFRLAIAGNHCQGTLFRDGAHLITPQLEAAIDRTARSCPRFHFGRLDVRYRDVDAFMRGEDVHIVEVNGVTSESTNLYDPSHSLLTAYRILFRQWSLLFRIGAMNRARGISVSTLRDLGRDAVRFYSSARATRLSD